jgi:hypothetical protein
MRLAFIFALQGIVFPVLLYDIVVYCWLVCPGWSFQQGQPRVTVLIPGPGGYFFQALVWCLRPQNLQANAIYRISHNRQMLPLLAL